MKWLILAMLLCGCESEAIKACSYGCKLGMKSYSKTNGCECVAEPAGSVVKRDEVTK